MIFTKREAQTFSLPCPLGGPRAFGFCIGVVPMQMRFYPGVRFLIEWTFVPNCIGVVPMQTRFHPAVQLLGLLSSLSRKRAASFNFPDVQVDFR